MAKIDDAVDLAAQAEVFASYRTSRMADDYVKLTSTYFRQRLMRLNTISKGVGV
jgi:hypothetical protein